MRKKKQAQSVSLKWEALQRMKFLDGTLLMAGAVSTMDLINAFGISRAQATKDIGIYREYFDAKIEYNATIKRYQPADDFEPIFLRESAQDFFDLLRLVPAGHNTPIVSLVPRRPNVAIIQPPDRLVALKTLSLVSISILQKRWLRFSYQSLNSKEAVRHEMAAHVLVYNGLRWHVRGYSKLHGEFRDFVLGRFKKHVKLEGRHQVSVAEDKDWNQQITVEIAPHPGLTKAQRDIVRLDYGMRGHKLKLQTNVALLSYLLRLLNNVGDGDERLPPQRQQIILANKEEILPLIKF